LDQNKVAYRTENGSIFKGLPLFEFRVDQSVGKSLSADTNSLQYTVTLELVKNQLSLDQSYTNGTFHHNNIMTESPGISFSHRFRITAV